MLFRSPEGRKRGGQGGGKGVSRREDGEGVVEGVSRPDREHTALSDSYNEHEISIVGSRETLQIMGGETYLRQKACGTTWPCL